MVAIRSAKAASAQAIRRNALSIASDPKTLASRYRADFRPVFLADRRLADAPRVFGTDFAAVFFVAVFFEALRALAVFALGFAGLFFFGDAAFTFRVVLAFRFLAAPIAAPDKPPITVPTTGTPKAEPATAPATAPPSVLAFEPMPVSPISFSLSSMFSPSVSDSCTCSILLWFFHFRHQPFPR